MKLQFNAVWQLQTVVICPSCGKSGKDAEFKDCCFRFALMRLGIQDRRKCPLCGEGFVSDDDETGCFQGYCVSSTVSMGQKRKSLKGKNGYCYAYEDDTQESCKYYLPYMAAFTNGANWECQHRRLDGRCAV